MASNLIDNGRWWSPGDVEWHPADLPQPISTSASCVYNGEVWIFGGYTDDWATALATVYSFDPQQDVWTAHPDLPAAVWFYSTAAVIGDVAYFIGNNGVFYSYNMATGTPAALTAPTGGGTWGYDCVAHGGYVYWKLSAASNAQRYDPALDSWSAITPLPNLGADVQAASALLQGDEIYVLFEQTLERYSPLTDSWLALTAPSWEVWGTQRNAAMVPDDSGHLLVAGGYNDGTLSAVASYDILNDTWTALADMSTPRAAAGAGLIDGRFYVLGGEDDNGQVVTSEAFAVTPGGPPVAALDVVLSTEWPPAALLPVLLSTSREDLGDASTPLYVVFATTTSGQEALPVLLDVASPDGTPVADPPDTAPLVTGSIRERVGSGISGTLEREDEVYPTASDGVFETVEAESDGVLTKRIVSRRLADAPYGRSWAERGGIPVAALRTPSPAQVLDDTILPELTKTATLTDSGVTMVPSERDTSLYPLSMVLGEGELGNVAHCYAREATAGQPGQRQTRMDLAEAAVAEAGVQLVVFGEIPNSDRIVDPEYTTEGETAAGVLSDMLFASSPRVWYTPGVVYVDGRIFEGGAGSTDPTTFIARDDLVDNGATWQDQAPADEPEPLLEDYTERCQRRLPPEESDDPNADGTFETFDDGEYSWVERSGRWKDYKEVYHTITKVGGQVTKELAVTYGYWYPAPYWQKWGVVTRAETTNTYHPICPDALVQRTELTMQRKSRDDISRLNVEASDQPVDSAPWAPTEEELLYRDIPSWFALKQTTLSQVWHAEGWLRTRNEMTREMDGMVAQRRYATDGTLSGFDVTLLYQRASRDENYIPVGNGLWRIATTVRDVERQPVYEPIAPGSSEVEMVGVNPVVTSNSYTVVTDQAPPQVSCPDVCDDKDDDPYQECINEATEQWEIDHADWEARQAHNGAKRIWTIEANHLLPGKRVGQLLGGGFIAGVTHTLDTERGQTSLEVWEWLA